ncbi:mechanosensitive ion channel family protein [Phyllobacterium zundukense]|uniref:Small mechanosensitive ion channel n=1 Tax=Phyllobacterium zundukense TaxID=1867719 RepID=A0A2N9W0E5_9HYPH|nr:mechanosensitive ion channel family protein [Phyllobacterium zundukense]ATU90548.1 small mechanosensitive ion channel [Phyllobacterium zundukense]PIO45213.1 small mechanosensitive ion channel [Phyllobacterium zundukense]
MSIDLTIAEMMTSPIINAGWVALAGVIVTRALVRHHAFLKLIAQIAFFIALTGILLANNILPYDVHPGSGSAVETVVLGLVKIVWWMNVAWALIAFVRLYLVLERKPREARLIQDIVVGLIYLGTALSIVAFVFSVPVGTLLATSGIFAIILGLALQNTLSDAFSGVALNLGRPFVLGDWIKLSDGTEGRVVESNWRATHLLTAGNNIAVLPNGFLAKLGLTNVSHPNESHGMALSVRLAPTKIPSTIIECMQMVLLSCNSIVRDPAPLVSLKNLDATAIEVELLFQVSSIAQSIAAKNELIDLIYRHTKSAGLLLSSPASSVSLDVGDTRSAVPHSLSALELLEAIPLFSALTHEERRALADKVSTRTYRKDEVIVHQGQKLCSLMIVRSGVLVLTRQGANGEDEIERFAPGDFFGEDGLLAGTGEPGTVTALAAAVLFELDQKSLAPLLKARPDMADDLASFLAHRFESRLQTSHSTQGLSRHRSVAEMLKSMETVFRPNL